MIKILVIDDEQGICDFISDFFERRGHIVFTAADPGEALLVLKKEKPHIILLDIMMPQMSGLDLLKKIREKNKHVKIIMVTVVDDTASKKEAFNSGADDFIVKPFTTDYLASVVMSKIQQILPTEE